MRFSLVKNELCDGFFFYVFRVKIDLFFKDKKKIVIISKLIMLDIKFRFFVFIVMVKFEVLILNFLRN